MVSTPVHGYRKLCSITNVCTRRIFSTLAFLDARFESKHGSIRAGHLVESLAAVPNVKLKIFR